MKVINKYIWDYLNKDIKFTCESIKCNEVITRKYEVLEFKTKKDYDNHEWTGEKGRSMLFCKKHFMEYGKNSKSLINNNFK